MVPSDREEEVYHNHYMPDDPTILLEPDDKSAETRPLIDLRQRLLQALRQRQAQMDRPTATGLRALDVKRKVYGQVEPGEPAVPVNPVHDAPTGPFSERYVRQRLNRCICDAQDNKQYTEAIRLQRLLWKLEDNELSPINAAREAWLRPAWHKHNQQP